MSRPLEFDSLDDLPKCCAGEGYPGIAHDLNEARRERDEARQQVATLREALELIATSETTTVFWCVKVARAALAATEDGAE